MDRAVFDDRPVCKDRIPVLLPVRNMAGTVERAIQSLLNDGVTQIIVIDDGSTDGTAEVVMRLAEGNKSITMLRSELNGGLGHALNLGLKLCDSDFVLRQDADDESYWGRSGSLRAALESQPNAVAAASWFVHETQPGKVKHGVVHAFPNEVTTSDLLNGWRFPHAAAMYRRSALLQVGGWPEDMQCSEDQLLHLRLSRIGKLIVIPHALYFVGDGGNRQVKNHDTVYWDRVAVERFQKGLA
ncbi:MAG: glycosyltransferase family A protein [Candidatus Eisenbacteria bacterium]|nr:glycosyltransferase family A protein [Candidatus Eisenbacteria bacterium]